MPDFPIVDSHVHLLDPRPLRLRLDEERARSSTGLVLPSDLTAAAGPVEIEQFVFVEVDVDFPQHLDEAAWVRMTPMDHKLHEDLARRYPPARVTDALGAPAGQRPGDAFSTDHAAMDARASEAPVGRTCEDERNHPRRNYL